MSISTLKERMLSYESDTDYKLCRKLPVIIVLNGRSFKKTTSLLHKPFDLSFTELMCSVMIKLAQEIDGTTFVYGFNDEIVLISKNDQNIETTPWCNNKIQKIVSLASSIATLEINRVSLLNKIPLFGDVVFTAHTFVLPTMVEVSNFLISKQQQAFHTALHNACFYELIKKYDPTEVAQSLLDKTGTAKNDLLFENCGIDFSSYSLPFRLGTACYRAPKIINNNGIEEIKNKLIVNMELPLFVKNIEFLNNILKK